MPLLLRQLTPLSRALAQQPAAAEPESELLIVRSSITRLDLAILIKPVHCNITLFLSLYSIHLVNIFFLLSNSPLYGSFQQPP